mmetsp:Transcript_14193/g.30483  ORF Transcript_14193/g.30483 Transcript_14193/m.30483 type:complete len:192 (-) Transcript_14193:628-1203(-)
MHGIDYCSLQASFRTVGFCWQSPTSVPLRCVQGVEVVFVQSVITCNNLGGLGPHECPERNIRYTNIGSDFGDGTAESVVVDLIVTNLTVCEANNAIRNGGTDLQTGQFGQVNRVDDYGADIKYGFFLARTDIPVALSHPFSVVFLDFEFGDQRWLTESMIVHAAISVATIEHACREPHQPSSCLSTTVIIE